MPHAAAMVAHGGAGTTLAALTAGVPLVLLPLSADQPINARRVAELGAGLALDGGPRRVRGSPGPSPACWRSRATARRRGASPPRSARCPPSRRRPRTSPRSRSSSASPERSGARRHERRLVREHDVEGDRAVIAADLELAARRPLRAMVALLAVMVIQAGAGRLAAPDDGRASPASATRGPRPWPSSTASSRSCRPTRPRRGCAPSTPCSARRGRRGWSSTTSRSQGRARRARGGGRRLPRDPGGAHQRDEACRGLRGARAPRRPRGRARDRRPRRRPVAPRRWRRRAWDSASRACASGSRPSAGCSTRAARRRLAPAGTAPAGVGLPRG